MPTREILDVLIEEAIRNGATAATHIPASHIRVENSLASLCNGEFKCPNFGLSAGCPPHVEGPAEFKLWRDQSEDAVTVKIEMGTQELFSEKQKDFMRLLHLIVATVEQKAIELGFSSSKGFAGGSCKELFCYDQDQCPVISDNTPCLHPNMARPSISGFGVDAVQLMKSSGWPCTIGDQSDASNDSATSWIVGLVLIS